MNLSIQEILTQALGFIILLWILKKLAWKPILELLESRRLKIETSFREIDQAREEITRLKADYDSRLHHIEEESRDKINEAIHEGKHIARDIQDQARNQAKEILEKAREDISLEVAKAQVALRKEIADLVFHATERVLGEKLSEKKDEEMILKLIKEIEEDEQSWDSP